ncbi:MAG TPA: XRE family transcriptional regulator [Kineosporiaceae bacterium]
MARRPQPLTLADKLNHLFATVRPAKGEYTHEQVATAIEQAGGPTISATYVWQLRKGLRDNPTKHHLEALAAFFGVPAAYFLDDETAARVDEQLDLLAAFRDPLVRELAVRASGLSPQTLKTVIDMVERARELEGLPPATSAGARRRTRKAP